MSYLPKVLHGVFCHYVHIAEDVVKALTKALHIPKDASKGLPEVLHGVLSVIRLFLRVLPAEPRRGGAAGQLRGLGGAT